MFGISKIEKHIRKNNDGVSSFQETGPKMGLTELGTTKSNGLSFFHLHFFVQNQPFPEAPIHHHCYIDMYIYI